MRPVYQWQEKIAPLQDKIFKYMEREMGDIDESDKWKVDEPEKDENEDDKLL
jgi:transposase-like protein